MKKYILILLLLLIIVPRVIPYINNNVPLGYDSRIYNYIIAKYNNNQLLDSWIENNHPQGLFILTKILGLNSYSNEVILTYFLIFLTVLLGLLVYLITKEYFNEKTALFSLFFYAISITQFKTFSYMYYKNILALILLLLAFYLLKKEKHFLFILVGSFLAGVHRPSFLIFSLVLLLNIIIKKDLKLFLNLITIYILGLGFYLWNLDKAILSNFKPILSMSIGAGTFINLYEYKLYALIYLPFLIFSIYYLVKEKKYNLLLQWFFVNFLIVILEVIFYNRYLIQLDLIIIILAGYGVYKIYNFKYTKLALSVLFILGIFIIFSFSINEKPLISEEEFNLIKDLDLNNSFLISDNKFYSTWLLYSNAKVIAPGMFDYDKWSYEEWLVFWNSDNQTKINNLLSRYERPLYVYSDRFKNNCFRSYIDKKVYEFIC